MAASAGFVDLVKELFAPVGFVTAKRMFGGAGIYVDGSFIAIVDNDVLYFKTDDDSRKVFEEEGTGPFTYDTKHGPGKLNSYWRAPERLLDDGDEMAAWARIALGVARRAAAEKPKASKTKGAKRAEPRAKPRPESKRRRTTR